MIKSINLIFMTLYFKFFLRFLKIAGIYEIYITNYGVSLWMQKGYIFVKQMHTDRGGKNRPV